jgi:hypothetical protein
VWQLQQGKWRNSVISKLATCSSITEKGNFKIGANFCFICPHSYKNPLKVAVLHINTSGETLFFSLQMFSRINNKYIFECKKVYFLSWKKLQNRFLRFWGRIAL